MNLPGRHPGIDYTDTQEVSAVNCEKDELVDAITKKVLDALNK